MPDVSDFRECTLEANEESPTTAAALNLLFDREPMTLMFVLMAIIVLTICFELASHQLLHKTSHQIQDLLRCVYSELAVLGFISFLLFLAKPSGGLCLIAFVLQHEGLVPELVIEWAHAMLFFVGVYYVLIVAVMLLVSRWVMKRWDIQEALLTGTQLSPLPSNRFAAALVRRWRVYALWRARRSQHSYSSLRTEFIQKFELSASFPFNEYLKRQLESTLLWMAEIHWSVWVIYLCLLALNLIRLATRGTSAGTIRYVLFFILSVVLCLMTFALYLIAFFVAQNRVRLAEKSKAVVSAIQEHLPPGPLGTPLIDTASAPSEGVDAHAMIQRAERFLLSRGVSIRLLQVIEVSQALFFAMFTMGFWQGLAPLAIIVQAIMWVMMLTVLPSHILFFYTEVSAVVRAKRKDIDALM